MSVVSALSMMPSCFLSTWLSLADSIVLCIRKLQMLCEKSFTKWSRTFGAYTRDMHMRIVPYLALYIAGMLSTCRLFAMAAIK